MANFTSGRGDGTIYYASGTSRNLEETNAVNVIPYNSTTSDAIVRHLQVVLDASATPTAQWVKVLINDDFVAEAWGNGATRVVEFGPLRVPAAGRLRITMTNELLKSVTWYVSYEVL